MATRREKNPAGGLTAEGRRAFQRRDGSNLKPGVTGKADTPEKMRRKGSFLRRMFGRSTLPPLVNKEGKPTRLALSAHAWGEPVPKTEASARRLAAKGERLLERYKAVKRPASVGKTVRKRRAKPRSPAGKRR
ncbi:DUF6321 domain-containing protein [Stigmatella aurantiaca]|uniref:DUF6321 domain-containing protein n=1 Tax=Stigmatella aurantiaca (strain DW4/3-1) TaxID=378806 RepID=Q09A35_STIAD|nr:DUF6321 domain-containing protein [Stigmatella aurantiaca]ADO68909.1 uncharacterized protein STAUR_1105 [Stigmatella aurantiaca DW4/3-1]EAU68553.1 conserved hypothetical protein [Stigmatella aurantiaca DW4/3-1]